jgi:hypothetical protein
MAIGRSLQSVQKALQNHASEAGICFIYNAHVNESYTENPEVTTCKSNVAKI